MAEAIQAIMDAKLYPLLFVFLTNYQHLMPLGDIAQKAYHGRIIAAWQEDTITQLAADIMTRLQNTGVKEEAP